MTATLHIPNLNGKIVAVLGLGKSGGNAAAALAASGATVWAWDDNEAARAAINADWLVDLTKADWSQVSFLLISPGIPHLHPKPHPVAALAKAANVPVISDIELLVQAQPGARYVTITGTNGKSTTTTLIGHLLQQAGKKCEIGGNLGQAALSLQPMGLDGIYVLEMSSYQLEITPTVFADIAILLNITPDHLDRHGGMEGYIAAKKLALASKKRGGVGIIGVYDEHCRKIYSELKDAVRRLIPISVEKALAKSVSAVKGQLIDDIDGKREKIIDLTTIPTLPGSHNWQNAAAAYVAARGLGLSRDQIIAGLKSYPGLAHRQELVGTIGKVRYVNDSKATNADAAGKALACYDNIYWIIGGRAKEGGLAGLESFYPRIRHAFLIGEAAPVFAKQLGRAVPATQCGTLDKALATAHVLAQKENRDGATVLLSPACASWDQYPNFEARGDHFRTLVAQLAGTAQTTGGKA
ncbi:MAG: UDP-N-acetylmuramoyl-L-alanine--D-glutamate ligase [Rhodospirillaceae bacterium]|nr:MAG: UDP-N-acetylmuramoyl-L-alanine--D-glutamate ligase [Rhodospirillaceae bacterium]